MTISLHSPLPSSTHVHAYAHSHNRSHSLSKAELDQLLPVASLRHEPVTHNDDRDEDENSTSGDEGIDIYDEKPRSLSTGPPTSRSPTTLRWLGARASLSPRCLVALVVISCAAGLSLILLLLAAPHARASTALSVSCRSEPSDTSYPRAVEKLKSMFQFQCQA